VQLLLSIFIGWTILLSRVKADYYRLHSNASFARKYIQRPPTIIGILLIILGIIGFATGGISFTHQKKIVDAGPIQISHETQDTLPLSPILSTISLVAGLGLVVVGSRS
jgi:uncharacterized membrane protein YidH (DUF202 family)